MARTRTDASASETLVAWANAWLAGNCGRDEVADVLEKEHGPQQVTGVSHPAVADREQPLRTLLDVLRGQRLTAFRLALPAPGDPLGLTGPKEFNLPAVDAGEAVLVELGEAPLGLVPTADVRGSSYRGLRWQAHLVHRASAGTPTLAEAEQALNLTLRDTADALLALDTAGWRPAASSALAELRAPADVPPLAPGYPQRACRVAAQADRLAAITAAGLADDGGSVTAHEVDARRASLRDLEHAVRRALVAAHNAVTDG
ncbi:MAG: hypothetical protein GEV07_26910 [Streptosporangiales bacterium]|nr:hypothetical protein [Streptosporangiales bacterium]